MAPTCECPPAYLRTVPGILKVVEMIFAILTFACSFGGWWNGAGGGWVEFNGISCFIVITIWLILHLINIIPQILLNFLVEFISYCVMTIMFLISGIVAAASAGLPYPPVYNGSSVGAASFFAFAAMIACGIDAVFQYLDYRRGTFQQSTATTTVTTTTSSSSAVKVEY